MTRDRISARRKRPSRAAGIRTFLIEWTTTIAILLFGTTTLLQAFVVPTPSMESTLMVGDHLFVDKLAYAPAGPISRHLLPYREVKRGDIIVFRYPLQPGENYVKRVIGVPGDRIRIVNKQLWLNGRAVHEPYKQHVDNLLLDYRDNFPAPAQGPVDDRGKAMLRDHVRNAELVVPEGQYFALGDNRDNSLDSRYWGFVPRENIVGKPFVQFWSYETTKENLVSYRLEHFADLAQNFVKKTRWNRTLRLFRGYPLE